MDKRTHKHDKHHETSHHAPDPDAVELEKEVSLAEAISLLEAVLAGLKAGQLEVASEGVSKPLQLPEQVRLSLKSGRKKDDQRLSFKLSWKGEEAAEAEKKLD